MFNKKKPKEDASHAFRMSKDAWALVFDPDSENPDDVFMVAPQGIDPNTINTKTMHPQAAFLLGVFTRLAAERQDFISACLFAVMDEKAYAAALAELRREEFEEDMEDATLH